MKSASVFDLDSESLNVNDFAAGIDRLVLQGGSEDLSIYLHLPFCPSRCLSCDRVTAVTHDTALVSRYLEALDDEMAALTRRIGRGHRVAQVQVAGGTPNYLSAAQLARVSDIIDHHFAVTPETEMAIEANPIRCSHAQLELLKGLGYREIRFEVRELDSTLRRSLGRSYSPELLQDVFTNARELGFERITVDFIYGLPEHSHDSIVEAMSAVVDLEPDRILCHPFTRKDQQFPHQQLISIDSMPSLADKMSMFHGMVQVLEAADYAWIGINGFVRADDPLVAAQARGELYRGWLGYTDHAQPWLLGFGLGAISELPGLITQNSTDLDDWFARVEQVGSPVSTGVKLSAKQISERTAFMQLGASLSAPMAGDEAELHEDSPLADLQIGGLISRDGERLAVTDHGRYELNLRWHESATKYRWVKDCG